MSPSSLSEALRGLTVLELSRNLAGPYCTMLLGDLGADVITVESPRDWRRHSQLVPSCMERIERDLSGLQSQQAKHYDRLGRPCWTATGTAPRISCPCGGLQLSTGFS